MSGSYASGKHAWGECDVCGVAFRLHTLKRLTINLSRTNLFACPECWNPDHPQYLVGRKPVVDPQSIRDARPDNGLEASRDFQWGWDPVGTANPFGLTGFTSNLRAVGYVGSVTIMSLPDLLVNGSFNTSDDWVLDAATISGGKLNNLAEDLATATQTLSGGSLPAGDFVGTISIDLNAGSLRVRLLGANDEVRGFQQFFNTTGNDLPVAVTASGEVSKYQVFFNDVGIVSNVSLSQA